MASVVVWEGKRYLPPHATLRKGTVQKKKRFLEDLNDAPFFDEQKVKKLGDLSVVWIFAVLKQASLTPLDNDILSVFTERGPKPVMLVLCYVTGHVGQR